MCPAAAKRPRPPEDDDEVRKEPHLVPLGSSYSPFLEDGKSRLRRKRLRVNPISAHAAIARLEAQLTAIRDQLRTFEARVVASQVQIQAHIHGRT